jgi:hypothetical protein
LGAATRGRKNKKQKQKKQETSGLSAEMELRSHFSGKRSAQRRSLELKVTVCGIMDSFPAQSIDLSKSGILLQITDSLFADGGEDLASFAFKVQQHFQQGADILFVDHGFGVTASVVRVTHRHGLLSLACRFRHPLSDGQCRALEIEP